LVLNQLLDILYLIQIDGKEIKTQCDSGKNTQCKGKEIIRLEIIETYKKHPNMGCRNKMVKRNFDTPYYDGVFSVNKWRQKYVSCTLKRLKVQDKIK
jgi:hypothetical protein